MNRAIDNFLIIAFLVVLFVGIVDNLPAIRRIIQMFIDVF